MLLAALNELEITKATDGYCDIDNKIGDDDVLIM